MDKKPTYGRCFWSLIVACLLATPVLFREDSREVVKRWSERIQAVAGIVRRQEAAGEVSAYDGFLLARHFRLALLIAS